MFKVFGFEPILYYFSLQGSATELPFIIFTNDNNKNHNNDNDNDNNNHNNNIANKQTNNRH